MRAVIQRVIRASVRVNSEIVGSIEAGSLVLIGVAAGDTRESADYIVEKIAGMRIFADAEGKMNLPVHDAGGAILAVSQFTLFGDLRKGRRPSFIAAARPEEAIPLYEYVLASLRSRGITVECGIFGADMEVELINDGPVTILLDSEKAF